MQPALTVCLCLLLTVSGFVGDWSAGAEPPTPPAFEGPLIDSMAYPDAPSLRRAWRPMSGSGSAEVVMIDGRRTLRMPCDFRKSSMERASWDRATELDLTASRGVRFDFYCANPAPVATFNFYFRSGDGWYTTSFAPAGRAGWNSVMIDKSNARVEGQPGGWGTVDTLRVSAWRQSDLDTEFYIANLAVADARVAIIRGDSIAKRLPDEARSVATYSRNVADALDRIGVPYVVVSDSEVTAERLQGKAIAILPYNHEIPGSAREAFTRFLRAGGKTIAFYALPDELSKLVGIEMGEYVKQAVPGDFASIRPQGGGLPGLPPVVGQGSWNIRRATAQEGRGRTVATWFNSHDEPTGEPAVVVSDKGIFVTHVLLKDDSANKASMLLALLGHLDFDIWQSVLNRHLDRVGTLGPYEDFDVAALEVRRTARANPEALQALRLAETLRERAQQEAGQRNYANAIGQLKQARKQMLVAYCRAQRPERGEHRAWWCHSAFGVGGMSWDAAVKHLADNGFTAVIPNMLWGGVAFYDSDVLPVAPAAGQQGDQIAACVAACRKHNVRCHVWKVNWNMGHHTSPEFVARMQSQGRTQVSYDGTAQPRWLCPSHPDNQQLEIASMVEVATQYDVDGVHFDYIRYPNSEYCFCAGCRQRFEQVLGVEVDDWPHPTRDDPRIRKAWLEFRRANITQVVAAVHTQIKQRKPDVQISAAVFRHWPRDRDGVGQDWKHWCEMGYLDFVCPMDYTASNSQFEGMVRQQIAWAGTVPCYPGIGLSVWNELDVAKLIEQVNMTRRLGTGGFTVFNYGSSEAKQIVPLCGLGITRP